MYPYLTKGATVGHLLTRRLLRSITGIPGAIIDGIIALFWMPDYWAYWDDSKLYYADNTAVGAGQAITGWIGEILGYVIGTPIGILMATAIFFSDSTVRVGIYIQEKVYETLDHFSSLVSKTALYNHFNLYKNPHGYLEKAWNISTVTLGLVLGAVPYTIAKIIEFYLPVTGLSHVVTKIGGFIGGIIGGAISIPCYPVFHFLQKTGELYNTFRDKVRDVVALVYAKTGEKPARASEGCTLGYDEAMHSEAFREKVKEYRASSWTTLILGSLQENPAVIRVDNNDASPPVVFSQPLFKAVEGQESSADTNMNLAH